MGEAGLCQEYKEKRAPQQKKHRKAEKSMTTKVGRRGNGMEDSKVGGSKWASKMFRLPVYKQQTLGNVA